MTLYSPLLPGAAAPDHPPAGSDRERRAPAAAGALAAQPAKLASGQGASVRRRPSLGGFFKASGRMMSNPYLLMASLLLGAAVGIYGPKAVPWLSPIADVYIELLKMVLIPFMMSAIMVSLSRLLGSESMRRHIGAILVVFLAGLAVMAVLGLVGASILRPGGDTSPTSRQALGQLVNRSPYAVDIEIALNDPAGKVREARPGTVFDRIIPENIFDALTVGDQLKILFFAIAFGIGLGSLKQNRGDGLRLALLSVYDVCMTMIGWVNLLLPLALCAIVARQVATTGTAQLVAMIRFMVEFGLCATAVVVCSILVIAWAARTSLFQALRAIREPLILAIATRSSVTCIPSSMTALSEKLGYDRGLVEILLPLGITLFRFGPVLYYAFATIFVAQLHGIDIKTTGYAVAFAGALLAGLASAGTSGVLTISLLGVIFQPLGLPLEAALALLVTIDPVVDIFRTAAIVVPNCAAVAVVYRRERRVGQGEKIATAEGEGAV